MKVTSPEERIALQADLTKGVGQYRAEWLGSRIYDWFTTPAYWGSISGVQPLFIFGGRGTGKTHSLRALSFEGQLVIAGTDIAHWTTIGSYWRPEPNVIGSFHGSRLEEQDWERLFAHFLNLHFLTQILEFIAWRSRVLEQDTDFDPIWIRRTCNSLGVEEVGTPSELNMVVLDELARFQNELNRLSSPVVQMNLSDLGQPIDYLLRALQVDSVIKQHVFTFCIDEYETFRDYQQRVINTLVKHVGDSFYTFKIGARPKGLRVAATLSEGEFLTEPADYRSIDVVESLKANNFAEFAKRVCSARLPDTGVAALDLSGPDGLFPDLSIEEEARLQGVDARVKELRRVLALTLTETELEKFDQMTALSAYLVGYWAESQGESPDEVFREALRDPIAWNTRLGNYSYATLFTIRRGRAGHRKLYSGWSTMTLLADGNIRFILNLVTQALERHIADGKRLDSSVSPSVQTSAAMEVGEDTLLQLQGLDTRGAQLTRLTLGLGRIFNVFAAYPHGHTPEVAQFRVKDDEVDHDELDAVLRAAVMHSCLIDFAGDKMAAVSSETRGRHYQLHPVFAPFFLYSPRSKRRMTIKASDLLALTRPATAADAISRVIKEGNRAVDADVPQQLTLFSEHFQ